MTTVPVVVTTVEQTKAKAWVASIAAVLTVVVPFILDVATYLPQPWPAVIGGVIGLLGVFGVYQVPNIPKDTSVVPNNQIISLPPGAGYTPVPDVPSTGVDVRPSGHYRPNPWEPDA